MKKLLLFIVLPIVLFGIFLFAGQPSNNLSCNYNFIENTSPYNCNESSTCIRNESLSYNNIKPQCTSCYEFSAFKVFFNSFEFGFDIPENVKIISNRINIYEIADQNSEILDTAYYGEFFEVISVQDTFYEVAYTPEVSGYILIAYALDCNIKSPIIYLDTNATLTNASSVFRLVGDEYIEVNDIALEVNTRIKILDGYDINKEYCKVSFPFEDEIFTYYLQAEDINPDGIGSRFVIAISLIVVCVSIFLILYSFFRGRVRK